ncbi:MAG: thioredoxin domain-containing protein [Ignavibacteriales bacterium]|nr:thioredoxin domain-containing protein [Ignavibacteriales bacterium]
MNQKKFENRLIKEKSPYLLQHAYNPVNWFPWSSEAFEIAKKENRPIFLSIGYSTCHWCHVMEHESFEDEEVAKLLNANFVSIKVDREERPDIDNIYMSVCQMLTGSGGWPLTVILTPDQKPFFAGTYFPKHSRGRIGMIELIPKIIAAWNEQKNEILESAEKITQQINLSLEITNKERISNSIFEDAFRLFEERFDKDFGGFGERPKFPSPHNLSFLLRYYKQTNNDQALEMVSKTLFEMRKGGIYDQIGFGFHRYSTDQKWFLPHFEKMIYDQAMLIIAYSEAYQITKNVFFKKTVEETIEYVLRDMTDINGGFYSAEDADSEGEEGKFYVWKKQELNELLGKEDSDFISDVFNITKHGNYYEEATREATGSNILFMSYLPNQLAEKSKIAENEFHSKLSTIRQKIFNERKKRIHPYKDDKILTDWNGLMIAALSIASKTFDNNMYSKKAEDAVKFIFENLFDKNGNLLHRFRENESAISAQIDDYAFLIWGLLELYESTFKIEYLKRSIELTETVINNFWDKKNNSGFYFTSEKYSNLIARTKEFYDGAIPSGNSVMYSNLIKLNKITTKIKYLEYAENLSLAFKQIVERTPIGFSQFLSGYNFAQNISSEIIIVGEKENKNTKEIINLINSDFLPYKVVILIDQNQSDQIKEIAPFTKDYEMINGKTTVYICKDYKCELPTTEINKVKKLLKIYSD